jgi:serine/threonine protein kinase
MSSDEPTKTGPTYPSLGTGTMIASPDLVPISGLTPPTAVTGGVPPDLANCTQYADIRELGRGGMGVVYLARNVMMNRPEVLKVVNKAFLDVPGSEERFVREIRSAARLSHPNVVRAYSVQKIGESLVFVMEYVEGIDLSKLLKSKGALPIANACFYAYQTALGLQHAFEKQMVHRDIKPSNLILTREGKRPVVKILDFGLAKVTGDAGHEESLSGSGKLIMCTPEYVAPELTQDASKVDIRSDIYSLGCTLYYLLAGKLPFTGKDVFDLLAAHRNDRAPRLTEVRPEVPDGLSGLVAKMMAKDPAQRFQTPVDVANALKPFFRPGVDAEVIQSGIILTPVRVPAPEPPPTETVKPSSRPTRAMVDDTTPMVRKRPKSKRGSSPLTPMRIAALVVGGSLIIGIFIAWSAGAFKSRPAGPRTEQVGK